mgnify:CR=1 FL=1
MIKTRLQTFLLSLMVAMMATAQEVNLDSLYGSYLTDDERALIEKHEQLRQRLTEEKEQRQLKWTIGFAVCALVSLTTTVYIFKEVFKYRTSDTPLNRTVLSSVICICGGLVIFLLNLAWFYLSFEAGNKMRYLILYAIIILLGIALWVYTKRLKS